MQKCQKYQLLETSSSWFSCNINLWTGLDQFPGRHRDLWRQIKPIRRQDSLQSYNNCCYHSIFLRFLTKQWSDKFGVFLFVFVWGGGGTFLLAWTPTHPPIHTIKNLLEIIFFKFKLFVGTKCDMLKSRKLVPCFSPENAQKKTDALVCGSVYLCLAI